MGADFSSKSGYQRPKVKNAGFVAKALAQGWPGDLQMLDFLPD
jgi:hypothetical protein